MVKCSPRRVAYDVLLKIEKEAAYSHIALGVALDRGELSRLDKRLVTALVYQTLTWQSAIDVIVGRHVKGRQLHQMEAEVRTILRMGTCQARFMDRIPDHALVNESVVLCREVAGGATGLVNAVMRGVTKDESNWYVEEGKTTRARWLSQKYALPRWVANRLAQRYREEDEAFAASLNEVPPLYLRQVGRVAGGGDLEGIQDAEEVEGGAGAYIARGGGWLTGCRLGELEGDPEVKDERGGRIGGGSWVVQDLGSQLAGWYAGVRGPGDGGTGYRVLDGCAGLGGKTFQLLELHDNVTSVEPLTSKGDKLMKSATLGRLLSGEWGKKTHRLVKGRLQELGKSGYGPYDHVLVDAPCSGLGVLRRHPETRWLRRESDLGGLVRLQRELLEAAAEVTAPGGVLAYVVCTFTVEETEKQVEWFLTTHTDFAPDLETAKWLLLGEEDERGGRLPIMEIDWGRYLGGGLKGGGEVDGTLRLLPHRHKTDGFFAMRFRRRKE